MAPARIAVAWQASLKRLGVDCIDLYSAHHADKETPEEDMLAAFTKLVEAGKARAIRASNFSPD